MNRVLAGRYELTDAIARGGMGQVWRARDISLQRIVAVKVVDVSTTDDPTLLERFRREAIATAGLSHSNIVLVYDAGFDDDTAFLVMELLTGPSLQQLVREQGALPLDLGIRVASEVARGLQAAHRIGVIHRDVKPGNVMFHNTDGSTTRRDAEATTQAFGAGTTQQGTPFAPSPGEDTGYGPGAAGLDTTGTVKLVDFGIAQLSQNTGATLTAPATALGTAAYMAPEQASGTGASEASDWYALGCLMMTIFTGKAPFTGDTFAVAAQQITTEPPRLSDRRPDLPPALDELIAAMLAKDPAHRPNGSQILDQLRALAVDPNAPTMAMGAQPDRTRAMPATGPGATAMAPSYPATPSDAYDDGEDEYGEDPEQLADDKARKRGRRAVWFLVACILFAAVAVAGAMMMRNNDQVVPIDPQGTPAPSSAPATTNEPTTEAPTTKAPETTKAPATTKAPRTTTAPATTKAPTTTKPTSTKPKPTEKPTEEPTEKDSQGSDNDNKDKSTGSAVASAMKTTMKLKDADARSEMREALTDYARGNASPAELNETVSELAADDKISTSEAKRLQKAFSSLPS